VLRSCIDPPVRRGTFNRPPSTVLLRYCYGLPAY